MALWVRRGMSLGSYDDTRLCPDTRTQMNRDSPHGIVDPEMLEHLLNADSDHAAHQADQRRHRGGHREAICGHCDQAAQAAVHKLGDIQAVLHRVAEQSGGDGANGTAHHRVDQDAGHLLVHRQGATAVETQPADK